MKYNTLKNQYNESRAETSLLKQKHSILALLQEYCDFSTYFLTVEPFVYFLLQNRDQIKRKFTFTEFENARSKYNLVYKKIEVRDLIQFKGIKIKPIR